MAAVAAQVLPPSIQQDFVAALDRIGLEPEQRNAIIETSGCINIAMLGLLTSSQVSKLCKRIETRPVNPIHINTIQEQLLLAMRSWVINRQRLQLPVEANQFTMIVALNQAQILRQQMEDEARADKEPVAKAPDKFKTATSWKIFAEAMKTYLGQILGSGRIPLRYVIRRLANPDPTTVYANDNELGIAMAPLTGDPFARDNVKVYNIIKQLCDYP